MDLQAFETLVALQGSDTKTLGTTAKAYVINNLRDVPGGRVAGQVAPSGGTP